MNGHQTTHGHSIRGQRTKTYQCWLDMRQRCNNPNDPYYKDYGERGIKVHPEWDRPGGYEPFLAYMGERPPGMSIGRANNDGGYEPGNVRWETTFEQNRNKRVTKFFELGGRKQILPDWCREYGIREPTVRRRLRRGMSLKDALTKPSTPRHLRGNQFSKATGVKP